MAHTTDYPSIASLLSLRPENEKSWVLGKNPAVRKIVHYAQRAAEVQCTVLISGETGTGKEIWAEVLHKLGPRASKRFVPVNCAALTVALAESQLFGHEKGAFTGAVGRSLGVFRAASGGVVFLDEVGEMPLELQPKLLRVLQQKEITPLGTSMPAKVDVQVVAATNRDLEVEVAEGRFREDLYYRLNMVEFKVPSLRSRVDDIPTFVEFFSQRFAAKYERPVWRPDASTLKRFCEYQWPGNIRQLSHVIEQSYALNCAPIVPEVGARHSDALTLPFTDLARLRSAAVRQALRTTQGHKSRAARLLGVHANTMTRLLAQLKSNKHKEAL